MKKIALPLVAGLLIACGGSTEKKEDGFKFNRTKKEETKAVQAKTAIRLTSTIKESARLKNCNLTAQSMQA